MALWQIFNAKGVPQAEQFDDGFTAVPGEDRFTREGVDAHLKTLGKNFTASYMGTPNYAPPPLSAEDVAVLADLALAEIEQPGALALLREHEMVRAEFAPLFDAADRATKAKLAVILEARLAAR